MVLKLKMSQFRDVAEKGNQKPMADQVMMTKPELGLCVFVVCSSHLPNIHNSWLLWCSVFMQQLDCRELILNASYGEVWISLSFMSLCL